MMNKSNDITYQALGKWLGLSRGHVANILNGHRGLSLGVMVKIRRKTRCPIDRLMEMKTKELGDFLSRKCPR